VSEKKEIEEMILKGMTPEQRGLHFINITLGKILKELKKIREAMTK